MEVIQTRGRDRLEQDYAVQEKRKFDFYFHNHLSEAEMSNTFIESLPVIVSKKRSKKRL